MLNNAEIAAGELRLTAGKLKPEDVNSLVSIFRVIFAGLEEKYNYQYKEKLTALDNSEKEAGQVAAVLIKLQTFGFGVAELTGQRGAGVKFKQLDRYIQHALFAFAKIYPVPAEFSLFDIKRAILLGGFSTDSEFNNSSGGASQSVNAGRG